MVDNRSAGFYGIGGSFNFKSGDPSGTANKMSQEKYGSEAMYMAPAEDEMAEYNQQQEFVDRSALLRATLNSLAMNNVASVLNAQKHKKIKSPLDEIFEEDDDEDEEKIAKHSLKNTEEKEKDKDNTPTN